MNIKMSPLDSLKHLLIEASGALWKYDPNYYDVKLDRAGSR